MIKVFVFLTKLVSKTPLSILYLVSDLVSKVILKIVPYRKSVIDKNLEVAFPDRSLKERKRIRRRFYSFFSDLMVEGLKQVSISPEELRKRMKYNGYEAIDKMIAQGKSVLIINFHYSSWEWAFVGYSTQAKHPMNGIYQPMSNKAFGDMVVESRSRFGATLIPMNDTYNYLNDNYEKNAFALGLFPDQTPTARKGYWMDFFGRGTPVYRGPENLAKKFDLPVFIIDIDHKRQGYCEANIELLTDTPNEHENGWITEEFMKKLEAKIKITPEKYLWSHKRWKHTIPNDLPENQISKRYPPPKEDKIDY